MRVLDVVGRELRGIEAIGFVDELRQSRKLRIVGLALAVVVINETRGGWRESETSSEILRRVLVRRRLQMMIEPHPAGRVIRQVREDVVLIDPDTFVGDVLRMHEQDRVDRLLHRDDDGARESIEIAAGDETHGALLTPRAAAAQVSYSE